MGLDRSQRNHILPIAESIIEGDIRLKDFGKIFRVPILDELSHKPTTRCA